MSPSPNKIHTRAEEGLRAVLPRSVNLHPVQRDLNYNLKINGTPIQVKWIGECGLRQAREMLAAPPHRPTVVVARRMSPGAREEFSKAGIGWVDETGAAEIVFGQLIVSKTGRSEPKLEKPLHWTPSVLAVTEALICGTKPTVSATAAITTLSVASCTNALQTLTKLKLLTAGAKRGRESARHIADPDQLLDAYATAILAQDRTPHLTVGATWRDLISGLSDAAKGWNKAGRAWAATGAIAANVMAPYLTSVSSGVVYVDADTLAGLESAALDIGLRPIDGGRITLRPFPTVTTKQLVQNLKGLKVAPWPRVYVDLRRVGVRGEEAAEHLREVLRGK